MVLVRLRSAPLNQLEGQADTRPLTSNRQAQPKSQGKEATQHNLLSGKQAIQPPSNQIACPPSRQHWLATGR